MMAQPQILGAAHRSGAPSAESRPLVVGLPSGIVNQLRLYAAICAGPSVEALIVEALLTWLFWAKDAPSARGRAMGASQDDIEWLVVDVPQPVLLHCMRLLKRGALGVSEGRFDDERVPSLSFSGMVLSAVELFFDNPALSNPTMSMELFPSSSDSVGGVER